MKNQSFYTFKYICTINTRLDEHSLNFTFRSHPVKIKCFLDGWEMFVCKSLNVMINNNCRHFGPEKKMLSQYTPLCLGEGEGVWWSCSTFCLLLSEPLSKKISQWVLPCTLTNHIKVVYLVTHHRKKVIGPQITHVNNNSFFEQRMI